MFNTICIACIIIGILIPFCSIVLNLFDGFVDFISIDQISYEDYVYWHVGENLTYEDAEDEIESNNYLGQKKFKRTYMYNFKNPVIFDIPKK